jgi:hypothetical protein
MTAKWWSGVYIGNAKPTARVTVHRPRIRLVRTPQNLFATLPFGGAQSAVRELPNVKDVKWDRSVDQDVATCTIRFFNTSPLPIGVAPTRDLDRPGHYTYNHGGTQYSGRWKHTVNEWSGMLMPDNVLRTFEGYGHAGAAVAPDLDPNLVQTGEWLIDEVDYSHEGEIVVTCRDNGRLLLEHIAFPPVVPFHAGRVSKDMPKGAYAYPVSFRGENPPPVENRTTVPVDPQRLNLRFRATSNAPYIGNAALYGHKPSDAFDSSDSTYWLSIGNHRPDQGYSFEWLEASVKRTSVSRVRFKSWKAPHTAYISLYVEGKGWTGKRKVPYDPNHPASAPNGADIPYHATARVTSTGWTEVTFPAVDKVTRVRVCLTDLRDSGLGPYRFRAGLRRFEAYSGASTRTEVERITYDVKNYNDYTDIVKLLCAWGGFYWQRGGAPRVQVTGTSIWSFPRDDTGAPTIRVGRVWGDFQQSGTAGPQEIPHTIFDKKPLMDGIAYVRDILGFIFFIDELGGAVFKAPNIYSVGNTLRTLAERSGARTTSMITLDERQTLMGVTAKVSGRNMRERTFVSNREGTVGHVAAGWNPNPIGMRRVGGWTDMHFDKPQEARVMAEMIALRQLFTYRTDRVTCPGFPAIQIDDQVRVFERVTNEGYIHYVKGISSNLSHETGEYTYDLDTHWLGERPFKKWAFDPALLSRETQAYLKGLHS